MFKIEKIKTILLVSAIAVILVQLLLDKPSSAQSGARGEIERYQLFQGHYSHFDENLRVKVSNDEVFKIDTQTGTVWKFHSNLNKSGELETGWLPTVLP